MSIPFYPPSISTCILWLDASDPTCITVADGRVTEWKDKSQFSNNTTVVSAQGPLLSNINTLSSLFFQGASGSAQFFQGPLSSFSTQANNLSFYLNTFVVATVESPSVPGFFPTCLGAGFRRTFYPGSRLVQWSTTQANITVFPHASSNSNYAPVPGYSQPFLAVNATFYNATTSLTFLNLNGKPATRSDGTNTLAALTLSTVGAYSIGASLSNTTDFRDSWTGHIAEVIMYSNQLSWTERQHIEGYLATKWGFQSSLPASHPFKNTSIFLSTTTSAIYPSNFIINKNAILPSVDSVSTQLLWVVPQNQQFTMSSFALGTTSNQYIDENTSVVLNQTAQSALLVNNPVAKTWYVQSLAKNNLFYTAQNIDYKPYTQYPRLTRAITTQTSNIGKSVAISSDGKYVLAGDPTYRLPGTSISPGAMVMFRRDDITDVYSTTQTYISAMTNQTVARFGDYVAMTDDATYLVGTAPYFNQGVVTDAGYACIFKKSPTTDYWLPIQELSPPAANIKQNLYLGKSLAMSPNGDYIFLGSAATFGGIATAGGVFPYKKRATTDFWDSLPGIFPPISVPLASGFGDTLAINSNASELLIGGSNCSVFANNSSNSGTGSIFYYKMDPSTDQWIFRQRLLPSDCDESYRVGYALASSRDGNYFVARSYESNAYVYKKSPSTDYWNLCFEVFPNLPGGTDFGGPICSMSETGEYILLNVQDIANNIHTCILYQKELSTDIWHTASIFVPSDNPTAINFGETGMAMTPFAQTIAIGRSITGLNSSNREGVYVFKQSTIGTSVASNSFLTMDTTNPIPTILLPHPSTNPGQMIYIKDAGNKSRFNPICLSSIGGSFMNSTIHKFTFFDNNACLQLQSDGVNQYTFVNYYSGTAGFQPNQYNFRSFWVKGSTAGPLYNYPISIPVGRGNSASVTGFSIPQDFVLYQNIFFVDSDNITPIPFWNEYTSNVIVAYGCNTFWVKIPYIPPWPMSQQYFMYWNCNYLYENKPNEVFPFYDDFTGGEGASPDSNKWFVTKQGSENGVASLSGFTDCIHLLGVSNTDANTNIISKNAFLSNTFSLCFTVTNGANTFATVAFASSSNQQFLPTGGQSNWWWNTLGDGYTFTISSINRRFCFSQAQNSAPIILGCNTGGFTMGAVLRYEFIYTSNGNIRLDNVTTPYRTTRTNLFSFTDTTYLTSNKYIFFSQGSISGRPPQSTILCNVFIRPYVLPEPFVTACNAVNELQ